MTPSIQDKHPAVNSDRHINRVILLVMGGILLMAAVVAAITYQ